MRRILIICCILISAASCKVEENPIPRVAVYLNLDLTYEDKELKTIPSYKEYTAKNINIGIGERAGFGGILVVHDHLGQYKAFDRACPFEATSSVTVKVDDDILYAVCPKCGTTYEIGLSNGVPSGKSKHGLRQYNVVLNGNKLIVKN
jgi:hypothetical protein